MENLIIAVLILLFLTIIHDDLVEIKRKLGIKKEEK